VVVGEPLAVRIIVAALAAGELRVRGDEHHYLSRVRRARAGDAVELIDGAGMRARAVIERITDEETVVRASEPERIVAALPRIRVVLPLIKGDRMDSALEKLVEVGVDEILVWPAARSVVKLDADRREARLEKFRAAIEAAARQCGRAQLPSIAFGELASAIAVEGTKLVLDPASDAPLGELADHVTIISGPEGGLAPSELEMLESNGFVSLGLGPRVLRAETAPVIAVALVRAATRS
jgi:16S rRNA (uracil1498-N3)-methyltransferase